MCFAILIDDLGNFVVADQPVAAQPQQRLLASFQSQAPAHFGDPKNYFEQNWVWFGLALAGGALPDLDGGSTRDPRDRHLLRSPAGRHNADGGWRGVYDRYAYGEGLMPLDFDGLKKQRYRWALGGIQIIKFHWRELIPLAHHRMRFTLAQRIHYLLGSVQWFAEVLTAVFTVLLLATALAASLHERLPIRQLTGAVLVVPLAFAATGVIRATWAMRRACHCSFRDSFYALRVWFALSWVVTLACLRGLVQKQAEFLRTPKSKEGGSLLSALRASRAETALTVAAVLGGAAMLIRSPSLATVVLGGLLLFEAFVYSNAPWASMAAEGIILTPERQAYARSPQNTGDRPASRRRALAVPAGLTALVGAAAVVVLVASSPSDRAPFSGPQQDLPRIGNVGPNIGSGPTPSPTAAPSASASTAPSASPTGTAPPSATPSSVPTGTPGP